MTNGQPDQSHAPWTLGGEVIRLRGVINDLNREMDERVSKLETRMNIAIGGISVLGVTGIINLIANILQNGVSG